MTRVCRSVWVLLAALCLVGPVAAQSLVALPALQDRVTDLTGTLTAAEQAQLGQELEAFEQRKGAQLAVLVVATTAPESIEQYGIRVVEAWKLGREASDDGVLLLVARDDRALRIEVGHGLEGALTDATSRRIIDEIIVPLFRQGDYAGGIRAGLRQVMKVVEGEPLPPPQSGWQKPGVEMPALLPLMLIGGMVVGGVLRALIGRLPGAMVASGLAFGLALLVTSLLGTAIFYGVVVFFTTLVGGGLRALAGQGRGGGGFGSGGFGGGGFGGGGFGGGGFGGGGGSFGGGGASGRW